MWVMITVKNIKTSIFESYNATEKLFTDYLNKFVNCK